MSSPRSWFRLPFIYRPRAERRESPSLVATYWAGQTPQQNTVANLSNSGAYVLTDQNWKQGEILSLTLQRKGVLEHCPRLRFNLQVKAIRTGSDGVGVSFLLPRGTDLHLWESSVKSQDPLTEPEDVIREFRTAAALAFIHRVSPEAMPHATWLLRRGLSNHRLEGALEVILRAEEFLALDGEGTSIHIHPEVVLRVIEHGSWPETDWIQLFWSGLLASHCSDHMPASADLEAAELLSQLTTIQARLFAAACDGASKHVDSYGTISARRFGRSAEELIQISGTHDLAHIERDIQHLSWLGLIEQTVKWKFFSLLEEANLTPTALGLKLYARCHAHRGDPALFYGIESAAPLSCSAD